MLSQDVEDRLTDLETKLSFQEQLVSDLNDVITQQSKALAELERKVALLPRAPSDAGDGDPREEPPPPHY
ncbi:MAG: SlyX family protein [Pseudomonadota bacterium]